MKRIIFLLPLLFLLVLGANCQNPHPHSIEQMYHSLQSHLNQLNAEINVDVPDIVFMMFEHSLAHYEAGDYKKAAIEMNVIYRVMDALYRKIEHKGIELYLPYRLTDPMEWIAILYKYLRDAE